METKKRFSEDEVPGGFTMCTRDDCEASGYCLRHLAFESVGTDRWSISHVNPLRVVPTQACDYFRNDELVTYARGFKNMQKSMIPSQYETFSCRLMGKFGRTGYYERRRGERLCSPKDIKIVRDLLREIGLPELEFDGYEKQVNWYD